MIDTQNDAPQICEDRSPWMQGLFILFFLFLFSIAEALVWACAVTQFFWLLFRKEPNERLLRFSDSLSLWLADAVRFVTMNTSRRPFPFSDWPQGKDV